MKKLCKKCNGDNICTKCQKNSQYNPLKNKCECENGFIYNYKTKKCKKEECGTLCLRCDEKLGCDKCQKNSFKDLKSKSCKCVEGYYLNKKKNKCKSKTSL